MRLPHPQFMEEAQLLVRLHNIHAFLQLFKHDMYLIQNKAFCKYEETWKPNESQIVDATRKGFKFLSHETPRGMLSSSR